MRELEVPRVGFVKLGLSDALYLAVALAIIGNALRTLATGALGGLQVVLSALALLSGVVLVVITVWFGRRRVLYEEWANPVSLFEAARNHALFEGH